MVDKDGKKSAKIAAYTYDLLGRIQKETKTGSEDISYTYDSNNNRKEMTVGNKVTAYRYNKNDELLRTDTLNTETEKDTVVIYKNDKNGNQLATVNRYEIPSDKKGSTYVDIDVTLGDNRLNENAVNHYNALNQLTQTLTKNYKVSFTYDAEGLRTSKTVNGEKTVFVWDGDQLVMELSESGKVQKRYIRGNDLVYADKGTDSEKQYYVTDPHGNVVQLTDESGKVTKTYEYDSFGNELDSDSKDDNPFRYCGEYYDKETEEIYLRARYYQPEVGRFLTRDTYIGEDDEMLSLHLYTYCYNNPIMYSDVDGNCPIVDWVKSAWNWITGSNKSKKNKSKKNKSKVTPKPTTMPKPTVPTPKTKKTGFEITKKQLKKLGWEKSTRTSKRIKELNEWLSKYNMDNKNVICHFISQCMHECGRGVFMAEQWNGDPKEYFKEYETEPKKTWLGNTKPGDGFKFRGAGCTHITGRAIYTKFSNFVSDEKIKKQGANYIKKHKKYWWTSAVFFWKFKPDLIKCAKKKSATVEEVTKIVNGGRNGLSERKKYYKECKNIFNK